MRAASQSSGSQEGSRETVVDHRHAGKDRAGCLAESGEYEGRRARGPRLPHCRAHMCWSTAHWRRQLSANMAAITDAR